MTTFLADAPLTQAFPATELPIKKSLKKETKTIAIGGGKGGVGKTIFSVYLAHELSKANKRVLLVDSDFTSPCLHHFFQIQEKRDFLLEFERSDSLNVGNLVFKTEFPRIDVIFRYPRSLRISDSNLILAAKLIREVSSLNYDFIIFDLGSGLNETDIYIFLNARERIVLGTPEPAVIGENFRFLKICLLKKLEYIFQKEPDKLELIKKAYFQDSEKINHTIKSLISFAANHKNVREKLKKFNPYFILNMADTENDDNAAVSLDLAMKNLCGMGIKYLGAVRYSPEFRAHLRKRELKPVFDVFSGIRENFQKTFLKTDEHTATDSTKFSGKHALSKLGDFVDPNAVICSNKCGLWNNCNYQLGGYPCRIKYIGYVYQN